MTHAHTHALTEGLPAVWLALGAMLALALLARHRRARWSAALSLALLVAVFGLESAIHSVHHLSDPEGADACVTLSGSQHLEAATAAPALEPGPPGPATPVAVPVAAPAPPVRHLRAYEGRAPPARPRA